MIAAGELNRRIRLLSPSHSVNGAGEHVTTWTSPTVNEVWANVRTLTGREMVRNDLVDGVVTYLVRVRYRADIRPDWRIEYAGRTLALSKVLDVADRREELEIAAHEIIAPSGTAS